METSIIKVGNSKGIIIPSKFLKLIGLKDKVSIDLDDNKLIIVPLEENARENWNALFSKANSKVDNDILIPDVFEDESFEDWTW